MYFFPSRRDEIFVSNLLFILKVVLKDLFFDFHLNKISISSYLSHRIDYQFVIVIVIKTLKISRSRNLSLLLSGSFHFSFFVFWTKTKKSAVLFLDGNVITANS